MKRGKNGQATTLENGVYKARLTKKKERSYSPKYGGENGGSPVKYMPISQIRWPESWCQHSDGYGQIIDAKVERPNRKLNPQTQLTKAKMPATEEEESNKVITSPFLWVVEDEIDKVIE